MKKFISACLLLLSLTISSIAAVTFRHGPAFNAYGKLSVTGVNGKEILFGYSYMKQWQKVGFYRSNQEYISWEYEKFLRKKLFNQSFFPYDKSITLMDKVTEGLMYGKVMSDDLQLLLYLRICRTSSPAGWNSEQLKIYYLLQRNGIAGDKCIKEFVEKMRSRSRVFLATKMASMDKSYGPLRSQTVEQLRQPEFNKYLQAFKRMSGGVLYTDMKTYWLKDWSNMAIIRAMLKPNIIGAKNLNAFCNFAGGQEALPDDVAQMIIARFKLNTDQPDIAVPMLRMIGLNQQLTTALLKSFNYIKIKRKEFAPEYNAMVLARGGNRIQWNLYPWFFFTYANAIGDYNKAYDLFKSVINHTLDLNKYGLYCNPGMYTNSISALLCGSSNLSDANAREIMLVHGYSMRDWSKQPNDKFAKLLKPENEKSVKAAQMFPFSSLLPPMQEKVFNHLLSQVSKKTHDREQLTRNLATLAGVDDPAYRVRLLHHLFKELMKSGPNHVQCAETLQGIAPFMLKEIIKFANSSDPATSIAACQLIGSTGKYGKSAAPELRKLLSLNNNFTIKIACMLALVEIGDHDSVKVFEKYLKAKNRLLAKVAGQSIKMLKPVKESYEFYDTVRNN